MTADELKAWRDRLGLSNREAAELLALTAQAFLDQIYAHRRVSPRTERLTMIIEGLIQQRPTKE